MSKKIKGLIAPALTCFAENERLDEEATRSHVRFLMEQGIDGIMPCVSSGEFTNLSVDEYEKVINLVIQEVDHKIPVFVGATDPSTKFAIQRSKFAEKSRADGVMIAPPFCQGLTQEETYQHFKAISRAINIPIILYNFPQIFGVDVEPEQIAKMAKEGIISGVKEATGDTSRIQRILELANDYITVFYGQDIHPLGAFAAGDRLASIH